MWKISGRDKMFLTLNKKLSVKVCLYSLKITFSIKSFNEHIIALIIRALLENYWLSVAIKLS